MAMFFQTNYKQCLSNHNISLTRRSAVLEQSPSDLSQSVDMPDSNPGSSESSQSPSAIGTTNNSSKPTVAPTSAPPVPSPCAEPITNVDDDIIKVSYRECYSELWQ